MEFKLFIDEILVNIVNRLNGPDRQSLSISCKFLRDQVTQEHIRLIRNEAKRLLKIFASGPAPHSKRFYEDGLILLNNQPSTIDGQFPILCCFIRLIKYYHVVQIVLCFINDFQTEKYYNLVVKIVFAVFKGVDDFQKGTSDSQLLCNILSSCIPNIYIVNITTYIGVKKLFKYLYPTLKQSALKELKSLKLSNYPFLLLISKSLMIQESYYRDREISEKLSMVGNNYLYFHNDLMILSDKEKDELVEFYKNYPPTSDRFSIVFPLNLIHKIRQSIVQQNNLTDVEEILDLLSQWFRSNCCHFYTMSEFCTKAVDFLNDQKYTMRNMNWPLTMQKCGRTGIMKWVYFNDMCIVYPFTVLIYFMTPDEIVTWRERFSHRNLSVATALKIGSIHHDNRESLIMKLSKRLFTEFMRVYEIDENTLIDIILYYRTPDQKMMKILVNYHIFAFICKLYNRSKKQTLIAMLTLPLENFDNLHQVLIDFYFGKFTEQETREKFDQMLGSSDVELHCERDKGIMATEKM